MQQQTNLFETNPIPRAMQFTLFVTALAWSAAASTIAGRAADGIAARFQLGLIEPLLESAFLLFLAVLGFRALDGIATRGRFRTDALPLPRRSGWQREWSVGAAIGWGLALAVVAPVLLTGNLHGRLIWNSNTAVSLIVALATIFVSSLAIEVVFHGYAFRRLIAAIGPNWAAVLISVIYAALVVQVNPPRNPLMAVIDCTLFALLLAMAWLRTHALWLGWGLRFAYRAVMTLILGLPAAGRAEFGSPTDMFSSGPRWLTGGAFGLDAALLTSLILLGGMIALYRATRDYAWAYTHPPIVPAGYEVNVPPPAAHVAMENAAPAPPPLVQILPAPPPPPTPVEQPIESEPTA